MTNSDEPNKGGLRVLPNDAEIGADLTQFTHRGEFKRILDQVVVAQKTGQIRSIAILSELPGEGKTFFASALATGISEMVGSRVLIVDTATSSSKNSLKLVHSSGVPPSPVPPGKPGEADSNSSLNSMPNSSSDTFHLHEWTDGKAEGAEYHVSSLIDHFKSVYELILFDTSAMAGTDRGSVDPVVIAHRCQASILITSARSLATADNKRRERIQREKLDILGVVFNSGALS